MPGPSTHTHTYPHPPELAPAPLPFAAQVQPFSLWGLHLFCPLPGELPPRLPCHSPLTSSAPVLTPWTPSLKMSRPTRHLPRPCCISFQSNVCVPRQQRVDHDGRLWVTVACRTSNPGMQEALHTLERRNRTLAVSWAHRAGVLASLRFSSQFEGGAHTCSRCAQGPYTSASLPHLLFSGADNGVMGQARALLLQTASEHFPAQLSSDLAVLHAPQGAPLGSTIHSSTIRLPKHRSTSSRL